MAEGSPDARLRLDEVAHTWWPLAASWLLMGLELPALSAVVARLPDPETHLAAYGGVVFPVALLIEAPIVMLLSASTALSKDRPSYMKLRRFMHTTSAVLTLLHALVAFTPLYEVVAVDMLGAPEPIVEPGRIGLMIMMPWTWAIAYRRFHQGVLIRFGHARAVGLGTVVRMCTYVIVLGVCYVVHTIPGIVVGSLAVALGVTAEAIYIGFRVQPVLRDQVYPVENTTAPLSTHAFVSFYAPLALTSLLTLASQPIGSAAMGRMSFPIESLAVWPALEGFLFITQSLGIAYNEVVVALLARDRAVASLRRFALLLCACEAVLVVLVAFTPISTLWFVALAGLTAPLAELAKVALALGVVIPPLAVAQSWYQGLLVFSHRTRAITEAVALFLTTTSVVLVLGVLWSDQPGVYVCVAALAAGSVVQTLWLRHRARDLSG